MITDTPRSFLPPAGYPLAADEEIAAAAPAAPSRAVPWLLVSLAVGGLFVWWLQGESYWAVPRHGRKKHFETKADARRWLLRQGGGKIYATRSDDRQDWQMMEAL